MGTDPTGRSFIGMDVSKDGDEHTIAFAFNDRLGTMHLLDVVRVGKVCAAKGCCEELPQGVRRRLFCGSHWGRLPLWLRATLRSSFWKTQHLVLARNIVGALEAGNLYGAALDLVRHYREIDDYTLMDELGFTHRQAINIIDQMVSTGVVDAGDELGIHLALAAKDCEGS